RARHGGCPAAVPASDTQVGTVRTRRTVDGMLDDEAFLALFLEAPDLPDGLTLTDDSRDQGVDSADRAFEEYGGLKSGLRVWRGRLGDPVDQLVDIRWLFPSAQAADAYHRATLLSNSEGM